MQTKTGSWFDEQSLDQLYKLYSKRSTPPSISYATVKDYCDSFDNLRPLATLNLDLKDVQRPWMFKTIVSSVPRGGRLLEIGAGEPWVADLLQRLGYEVWIVDPYDGSGNGPGEYDAFSKQCPRLNILRHRFSDQIPSLKPGTFDCIYSISVLEHLGPENLHSLAAGVRKYLRSGGANIHAIDHVHKGNGADTHLANLKLMTKLFGLSENELANQLQNSDTDTETYYLSAESHNRWRGAVPYSQFPMRVCLSVQMLGR